MALALHEHLRTVLSGAPADAIAAGPTGHVAGALAEGVPTGNSEAGGVAAGGVAAGGRPVDEPSSARRFHSVRGARDRELVEAAQRQPTRGLLQVVTGGDLPDPVLPLDIFVRSDGLERAREAVLEHTPAVPRVLDVSATAAVSTSGCSIDVDGLAINVRGCPSSIFAAVQILRHARERQQVASGLRPDSGTGAFAAALRSSIAAHVEALPNTAGGAVGLSSSALLRGASASRPLDLAIAAGASALDPPVTPHDAHAAVAHVFGMASDQGIDLSGQLVSVPASGSLAITDESPTVESGFAAKTECPHFVLPSTTGLVVEPFSVISIGFGAQDVAKAVRDVLAAIVSRDGEGSTGVMRALGSAARGPNDHVTVGGGGLVALSILTLLLVRRHSAATRRPLAFIKS